MVYFGVGLWDAGAFTVSIVLWVGAARMLLEDLEALHGVEEWRQSLSHSLGSVGVRPWVFVISTVGVLAPNGDWLGGAAGRGVFVVLTVLILAVALFPIHSKDGRKEVHKAFSGLGPPAPVVYLAFILGMATAAMGGLLAWFSGQGWVEVRMGRASTIDALSGAYFFLWHLIKGIPVLEIPDSFNWKAPLTYQDKSVGALVVLYKVVVITPAIAYAKYFWENRHNGPEPEPRAAPAGQGRGGELGSAAGGPDIEHAHSEGA